MTVATAATLEAQVTEAVRSRVLPSLYVPMAESCRVDPVTMVEYIGFMASETRTMGLTVKTVEGLDAPEETAIIVPPGAVEVASPAEVMVATAGTEELHVALLVISWAVPSAKTPVAVNAWVVPEIIVGFSGLTVIEISEAGLVRAVGRYSSQVLASP